MTDGTDTLPTERDPAAQPQRAAGATAPAHILVVDDDPDIRSLLELTLTGKGYRVSGAGDGKAMRRIMAEGAVDLVILDLVLPGEDGLELARMLRARSEIGIIMLTGKGSLHDKVVGLEIGADDYLAKPFHTRELLARVGSVLRRQDRPGRAAEMPGLAVFEDWRLDFGSRELTAPDGAPVALTTAEYNLLAAFLSHPHEVLTRDQLMALVAERSWSPSDRSIDVLIGKLRRKVERSPKSPRMIKTVRQRGYTLAVEVDLQDRA